MYFPYQLPVLAIGIICYYIIIKEESLKYIHLISIFILCSLIIIQMSTSYVFFKDHVVFSLAFDLLTFALNIKSNKIFINSFTILIDHLSFSLYLCHIAVLYWLEKFELVKLYRSVFNQLWNMVYISIFIINTAFVSVQVQIMNSAGKIWGKRACPARRRNKQGNIAGAPPAPGIILRERPRQQKHRDG